MDYGGGTYDAGARETTSLVETEQGRVRSATGCALDYRLYRPVTAASSGVVIVAHGFMRSKERMDGLARALADRGMTAATIDFCNARLWSGAHLQNGRDMVALAHSLGLRPVVYMGFSAGALAAVVAAERDANALGVIALDLVDDGGLGVRSASRLDKPLIGLMGEPSACNAEANGLAVFAAARRAHVEQVTGAGHCDFESPTNWFCEAVCGRTAGSSALRDRIIARAAKAVAGLLRARSEQT